MAGMLPGVESARWRKFYQSKDSSDSPNFTRRSSLCLYASKHDSLISSTSSSPQLISGLYQTNMDEKVAGAAGEAKQRLHQRLRSAQITSNTKTKSGDSRMMFNWRRLGWKA